MRLYLSASFCFIKAISWIPFLHGPVPTKHCSLCRKTMTSWKQQSSGSWPSLIWRDSKLEIHKILSAGSLMQSYWEVQPPCRRGTDSTSRSRVRNRSWGNLQASCARRNDVGTGWIISSIKVVLQLCLLECIFHGKYHPFFFTPLAATSFVVIQVKGKPNSKYSYLFVQ